MYCVVPLIPGVTLSALCKFSTEFCTSAAFSSDLVGEIAKFSPWLAAVSKCFSSWLIDTPVVSSCGLTMTACSAGGGFFVWAGTSDRFFLFF